MACFCAMPPCHVVGQANQLNLPSRLNLDLFSDVREFYCELNGKSRDLDVKARIFHFTKR